MYFEQIKMIQIDYFLAVATHLNFSKAAKSVYVSQPSLSKQIALLEHTIGVQLFFRNKRTVSMTPAGLALLKELSDIRQRLNTAFENARQVGVGEIKPINIGCLQAMNTDLFLTEKINTFKNLHPNASIVFERHSFKVLREKLINGHLDIVFTLSFEIDDSMDVYCKAIYETSGSIILASSHPLAQQKRLTVKDLQGEDFVLISRDESPKAFDSAVGICRKHGFTPHVVKQLPNIESLLLCVESGVGVSLVDSNIQTHSPNRFKLFDIDDDIMSIVMVWRKDNLNPAITQFTAL